MQVLPWPGKKCPVHDQIVKGCGTRTSFCLFRVLLKQTGEPACASSLSGPIPYALPRNRGQFHLLWVPPFLGNCAVKLGRAATQAGAPACFRFVGEA